MKIVRKNPNLDAVVAELTKVELQRVQEIARADAQASHCKGFSGDITLCAILCDGMACSDFEHRCGANLGCMANIKCRGFTGDGGGCGPFEKVPGAL